MAKQIHILSDTINSARGYGHIPVPCFKYLRNVEKGMKDGETAHTRELSISMLALCEIFGDGTSNLPFSP
jgi:hypothetical protein